MENDINYADFVEILEQYRSVSGNYLIGKINMHTLQNASWLKNEGVNLFDI